jgi:hypothetical protein
MKVFRLSHFDNDEVVFQPQYFGTLADAKKGAAEIPKQLRSACVAAELDVDTDKAGIVAMLNGEPTVSKELRKFNVTARGSLKVEA